MKKLLSRAHGHAKNHYHVHYRTRYQERAHLVFILDAILVSIAVGLLALGAYFSWFYHPLRDDFRVKIFTIGEVIGGQEGEISIEIENVSKKNLKDGRLAVRLPDQFLANDGKRGLREIEIGAVEAGASLKYSFRGIPLGAPGSARIVAHFEAYGQNGENDERLVAGDLRWGRSLIEARMEAPASIAEGQRVPIKIIIKNGSKLAFSDVRVNPRWPDGFRLLASTPPISKGAIALGELAPGEEVRVESFGTYSGETSVPIFAADISWLDGERVISIAHAESSVRHFETGLRLSAEFEQYSLKTITASEVKFVINYRNEGQYSLKNARFDLVTDVRLVDRVEWSNQDPIVEIAPGSADTLTGTIYLKKRMSEFAVAPSLKLEPEVTLSVPEADIIDATIRGIGPSAKIAGQAYLAATGRYHTDEGDQIGRGPWPPRVGSTSSYWVIIEAETGTSSLDNVSVNFTLPKNVSWTGRSSHIEGQTVEECIGGCAYDLTWKIGVLPAHAGINSPTASLAIEVNFTPSAEQAGTMPVVISEAALRGQDTWTDSAIIASIVNTGFPQSQFPQGTSQKIRP